MTSTDLYLAPKPFSPQVERCQFPVGWSVARSLTQLVNDGKLALDDVPLVRVYVQGLPLMAEEALDYIAQDGDVINVVVEPQGGETGKTIFQLFYTIGAAVVSFYFGPVWGAVVSIAGAALTQMIWKPEKGLPEGRGGSALQSQGNSNRQRQMMPLALGRQRVALDLAALPFTQNIGGDVWMTVGFGGHYGPCVMDQIKIGETLLSDYPAQDVQIEQFLAPGPRTSALYPTRVAQENRQNKFDFTGGGVWEVGTFAAGADYGEVDITLPSGLKYNADSGKTRNEEVTGRIEYAPVGTENWAPVPTISGYRSKNNQPLPVGTWFLNLKTNDAVRRTFRWPLPDNGQQYKFRAKAWDADGDFPNVDGRIWDTYLTAIRSVFNEPAFIDQNLSILVLKIKSSDDLNGQLPPVTAVIEPICPVFANGAWGNDQPTSNPAALLRWLLNGPAPSTPLAPEEFDASLASHYQLIEQRGWKGAYWVQDDVSQEELIIALGRMGRFSAYWNGEALCVVPDWEKPVARQLFTGRNVEGYRYSRSFPEPIHAVFVEFRNLDADSRGDELWVYADGYSAETAQTFLSHRLDFACTADRAFREGRVFLAKYELQVETHEWTAGVDSIVSSFGDRVRVRHPVGLVGQGEARVQFRRRAGGLVSGVRLDQAVSMEAGKSYGIDVRTADDGLILNVPVVTVAGETRELTFPAARAVDNAPAPGDLIAFGEMNLVTEDVELVDVAPDSDGTARLRAVKYLAAEIEAAETGPVPELPTLLKPIIPAPVPRFIGEPVGDPAGARIAFDVDPQRADQIAGFAARVRRVSAEGPGDWAPLPMLPPSARQVTTGPFPDAASQPGDANPEYVVQIDIRTIMVSGDPSQRAVSPNIVIQRGVQTPKGVLAAGVTRTAPDGARYPALYIEAQALEGGVVQDLVVEVQETGQADWVTAGQPLPAANPSGDMLNVQGGKSYMVRSRWRTADNWVSAWVTTQTPVLVPAGTTATDTINVGGVPSADLAQFYVFERPAILDDLAEARATLYTAGTGLVAQTSSLFAQLNTPTTGVLARLTKAETTIQTNNEASVARLDAIETTLNTADTGVVARLAQLQTVVSTPTTGLVSKVSALETQINAPSTGVLARLLSSETAITNLQTGKASVERVTLLETRSRSLPNLIEDGDFSQRAFGINWYREGGTNNSITYNNQIGSYASVTDYIVSKNYPVQVGEPLAVSWDGDSTVPAANVYLQAIPSYALLARASNSAALNNWESRKFSDPALSVPVPAGTTAFRVVLDPQGGTINASRIKVNRGTQATFWSDELTTRSVGASITTLETVTSDLQTNKASAQRVTLLEAGSDDVYLTQNTNFNVYTNGAQTGFTVPDFWSQWGEKVNDSHRVPGHIGPYAWWSHNNAGGGIGTGDLGITQSFNGNPRLSNLPATWYVLEADIWFSAGQIGGAGVLAYFDGGGQQMRLDFALDKPVGRDTSFGYDASPTGLWSFRKLIKPDNIGNGNLIFHVMTEWDGFEGGARPKVIEWQRCGIRLATPQEVAAERADANAGSALARVTTVENTSAELVARGGGGGNLVGNALLVNQVGWTVSLPNNAESTLDRANTGINYPSDNNWHPAGENCLSTHVNAPDASWYMDWFSDTFALEPGKTYEFGARAGVHRTQAQVYLQVSNIDGSQATYPQAALISNGQVTMTEEFSGGKDLNGYGHFWGKYTVPLVNPAFTRGRLILRRFSTNAGQADSWSWWTRPYCREIPSTQTRPSPWDSGSSQWNLKASWATGVSVPGADAFIEARAQLEDGRATSSVAIGARVFAVYNQIGQNWVKALEVVNGNAIFSGGLQAGAFIRLGNGNGWPVALRPVDFNLTDGEVCSFGTDLGGLPAVSVAYNNLAPLNNGETYDVRPINLTATGFTLYAKINVPAAPSNQSADTTKANTTIDGYPAVQLYLDGKPESVDGTYTVQASGQQNHRFIGKQGQAVEADSYSYAYTDVRVYAYRGGAWVLAYQTTAVSVVDPYQYPSGQMHTVAGVWQIAETIQLGSGVSHVAAARVGADNGLSGYVSTTGPVSWQAQGAASGVRSATPSGQKTRVTVRPQ